MSARRKMKDPMYHHCASHHPEPASAPSLDKRRTATPNSDGTVTKSNKAAYDKAAYDLVELHRGQIPRRLQ